MARAAVYVALIFALQVVAVTAMFEQIFGGGGGNFQVQFDGGDIMSQLFGGGGGGGPQRGRDSKHRYEVSLRDIYTGLTFPLKVNRQATCSKCKGTGALSDKHIKKCGTCGGSGRVLQQINLNGMIHHAQSMCPHCQGKGQVVSKPCKACNGQKVVREDREEQVRLEPGTTEGHVLRLVGMGEESPGVRPGDVLLEIYSKPHPRFVRSVATLYTNVTLSVAEALNGFTKTFLHLDDQPVTVRKDAGTVTQHGDTERLVGKGLPVFGAPGRFGDMVVTYQVRLPAALTTRQLVGIQKLFAEESRTIRRALATDERVEVLLDAVE